MFYFKNTNEGILLKNLINIRWIAIVGQLSAIVVVYFLLNIHIPLIDCLIVIIISILINFLSLLNKNQSSYLTEKRAFYYLLYDVIQLALLLFLTGGIYNPFCLLLIAPVIISATYLKSSWTVFLSLYSIFLVLILKYYFIPFNWRNDFIIPNLYKRTLPLKIIITHYFFPLNPMKQFHELLQVFLIQGINH